jgi:hypothetical protein
VPSLQLGHALFQPDDAWFELCFVKDAFGVTVDEPSNPTLQTGHLPLSPVDTLAAKSSRRLTRPAVTPIKYSWSMANKTYE